MIPRSSRNQTSSIPNAGSLQAHPLTRTRHSALEHDDALVVSSPTRLCGCRWRECWPHLTSHLLRMAFRRKSICLEWCRASSRNPTEDSVINIRLQECKAFPLPHPTTFGGSGFAGADDYYWRIRRKDCFLIEIRFVNKIPVQRNLYSFSGFGQCGVRRVIGTAVARNKYVLISPNLLRHTTLCHILIFVRWWAWHDEQSARPT